MLTDKGPMMYWTEQILYRTMNHNLAISCIWTKMKSQHKRLESHTSMLLMVVVEWIGSWSFSKYTFSISLRVYKKRPHQRINLYKH